MPPFRLSLYVAAAFLLCASPASALDVRETDILNLRLGMRLEEVEMVLRVQGIDAHRWERHTQPCPIAPASSCLTALLAPTRDGRLAIGFSAASGAVRRIDYVFKANGPGEPDMIRASVMRRFGDPSDVTDTIWCLRISAKGTCPTDQPHLRFQPGPGVTLILSLSDGSPG